MKREKLDSAPDFDLSGGVLCLDFANTVLKRNQPGRTTDELASYAQLVAFAQQTKLLSPGEAKLLRNRAKLSPAAAQPAMRAVVALREPIYRVFSSLASGKPVAAKDVKIIETFALRAWQHRRLIPASDGGYRWQWEPGQPQNPGQMLWPIALSATELLSSDRLVALRECAADDCAWLFLDESRNHSRRWCDMSVCGNRQKARRHYHFAQK